MIVSPPDECYDIAFSGAHPGQPVRTKAIVSWLIVRPPYESLQGFNGLRV